MGDKPVIVTAEVEIKKVSKNESVTPSCFANGNESNKAPIIITLKKESTIIRYGDIFFLIPGFNFFSFLFIFYILCFYS